MNILALILLTGLASSNPIQEKGVGAIDGVGGSTLICALMRNIVYGHNTIKI